jgi:aspartate kinase
MTSYTHGPLSFNTSEVCIGVVVERALGEEALACLKEAFRVG